jgi:uncharacterized protein
MLKVDLSQLEKLRRLRIDEWVPPQDSLWHNSEVRLTEPLEVALEAQQAGPDVVVRGTISGEVEANCRRCLGDLQVPVREEVSLLFRRGVDPFDAENEEVYSLPEKERELDLGPAIREQLLLAVPQFVNCSEECKGLCPHCGTNLNDATCSCETTDSDNRWAALRRLKFD